ncbi:hypothetical protein V6N13_079216 [Hibiscus sabdariffa]
MSESVQIPSKRVRLSNDEDQKGPEDIDHISYLPDSVLCHVLSFLPTKMSVATCVLSKRWIDIWTTVPALSFSSIEFRGRFVDHVYKVLAMFQTQTIHQFSLDFKPIQTIDHEHLDAWIGVVVERNLRELKLDLWSSSFRLVRLSDHIFACKTLVCLKLFNDVFVDVPANVCLQRLRILQLERVYYPNEDSLNRLISSCPILEDLIVERVRGDNVLVLDISVPSLKRINVKRPRSGADTCKLQINAPLLERIELLDTMVGNFQVEALSNLAEVIIHGDLPYCGDIVMLVRKMVNIKFMSLSECAFGSIKFHWQLPMFCYLVYLEITSSCGDWCNLVPLLKCSDNLKVLVFHMKVPLHHMGRYCDVLLPKTVPKCVSVSLKTLKLTGLRDKECNWNLVSYFLKNARFLKQMKIGTSLRVKNRCRLRLENLPTYPRASMACEIGFFIDDSGQEFCL